jgi:hypothetical protein
MFLKSESRIQVDAEPFNQVLGRDRPAFKVNAVKVNLLPGVIEVN